MQGGIIPGGIFHLVGIHQEKGFLSKAKVLLLLGSNHPLDAGAGDGALRIEHGVFLFFVFEHFNHLAVGFDLAFGDTVFHPAGETVIPLVGCLGTGYVDPNKKRGQPSEGFFMWNTPVPCLGLWGGGGWMGRGG